MIAQAEFDIIKEDIKHQLFKSNTSKPTAPDHLLRDTFQEYSRTCYVFLSNYIHRIPDSGTLNGYNDRAFLKDAFKPGFSVS